jgi:uncharacterized protein (DUF1800 family)
MSSFPQTSSLGLSIYKGAWTLIQTRHLLNRTLFGANPNDIAYFNSKGLILSVDELLNVPATLPQPPLNDYNTTTLTDPKVAPGTTWVNDISTDGTINGNRRNSYKKWLLSVWVGQERNIREKITLFWSNHFGTEADTIAYGSMIYNHHQILRNHCLGNFKQMVRLVTTDPGMLRYLNGYLNTKTAPDENFGRELQELFTVGKDGGAKYSEEDVKNAAKVLTGWRIDATFNTIFDSTRHDTTSKTFSSFYNNTSIAGKTGANGAQETDELLNMIFQKTEVAKFICRKIYRYFVYYYIDDTVEANIITPLANTFISNNFEIKPVLIQLLQSEHFYDTLYIGCQIKSPIDLVVGFLRQYEIAFPNAIADYADSYYLYNNMVNQLIGMGQSPVDPPNVAGWPAYYQAPDYNELWINADTFPKRNRFTDLMLETGYTRNGKKIIVNTVQFAKTVCSNPSDPNLLIDSLFSTLISTDISANLKATLKTQILLSGQVSDYYWTDAWNLYNSTPTTINYNIVNTRLKALLKYIMNLPDYQLQ